MAGSILTVFFGFFTASGSAFVRAILDESEDLRRYRVRGPGRRLAPG